MYTASPYAILKVMRATADSEAYHRDRVIEQHEVTNAIAETQGTVPMIASQVIPTSQITGTNGG